LGSVAAAAGAANSRQMAINRFIAPDCALGLVNKPLD
jgi:hypothetical protein